MLLSLNWLREFTPFEGEAQVLADRLTMLGLEVEDIKRPFDGIKDVVAGRVLTREKHPEADKLSVCAVDVGGPEVLRIVCGAANVAAGQTVPVALIGTTLPNGLTIKKSAIRGVESCGMICSETELGFAEKSSGIMLLPDGVRPGQKIAQALSLDEAVLEVSVTPNRADCLSHLGLARETATAFGLPLASPRAAVSEHGPDAGSLIRIELPEPDLCPVYQARVIHGAAIGESPLWMRLRLLAVGVRAISNVVDCTNYVLMELGQPQHAFDLALIEGGVIRVSRAAEGQRFTTLDGVERVLTASDALICDGVKPVALAGVMGGANSEINDASRDVLLECAVFNPAVIRKTARRLGLSSEASYRFERGVDQPGSLTALNRCAGLIAETSGGRVLTGIASATASPWTETKLSLRPKRARRILGLELTDEFCRKTLTSLGCRVEAAKDALAVAAPPYRLDLTREIDLIEEVGRVYGLDRIPAKLPKVAKDLSTATAAASEFLLWARLRAWAKGAGLRETIGYSFVGDKDLDLFAVESAPRIPVANPLSEDQNVMRPALAPGLLLAMKNNIAQGNASLRLFELAKVFAKDAASPTTARESGRLGIVLTGERFAAPWPNPREDADYLDLKGLAEHLFASLGLPAPAFERAAEHPWLSPCVNVTLAGRDLGQLGRILPEVARAYHARKDVWCAELDADALCALLAARRNAFAALPKFPPVRRDLTVIAAQDIGAQTVIEAVWSINPKDLEEVILADLFTPEGAAQRNLTLRLTYRAKDKTLTDPEVDKTQAALISILTATLPVRV
ncbi:MAG: phenylalanine--tRNA ligase subunit beta [Desulfovibrionaceae bacterium]|nr:phenylalanine--tRNA ligase subunit beta [Desulfovibrionaceae bacterium]MBF0514474.1 phenylalanine--tRNA ligase subunit beta [Desulfovibrionaceae bacterium]